MGAPESSGGLSRAARAAPALPRPRYGYGLDALHHVLHGPDLFASRPEFVAGLYWTLLLMNVVIILFLLVATNAIAKAALINKRFLGVAILTLSLIGTYASGYRFSDVGIAMVFAVLGYVLRAHRWPLTPILLGVVMGPIVEGRMRQALGGANGDLTIFVSRPISAIMVAALATLIVFTFRGWIKRRNARDADTQYGHNAVDDYAV